MNLISFLTFVVYNSISIRTLGISPFYFVSNEPHKNKYDTKYMTQKLEQNKMNNLRGLQRTVTAEINVDYNVVIMIIAIALLAGNIVWTCLNDLAIRKMQNKIEELDRMSATVAVPVISHEIQKNLKNKHPLSSNIIKS